MRESMEGIGTLPAPRRRPGRAASTSTKFPMRAGRAGHLDAATTTLPDHLQETDDSAIAGTARQPIGDSAPSRSGSLGSASVSASPSASPFVPVTGGLRTHTLPAADPDVWLIALPQPTGGLRSIEGAGHAGAIRVSRPYGHLRSIRPVPTAPDFPSFRQSRPNSAALAPTPRSLPTVVDAVEVETDSGLFRVERPGKTLSHGDMGWALAHLDPGEPDSQVPLSRRQLALLLTLLPAPEDPNHPEEDSTWGWAHKLRGPWERGPLHARGRLGRLIAFDPDESGKGMHRACFELLGTDEIVWAMGVPCFRSGSVYELGPIGKGLHPSRWLTWPLAKGRRRTGDLTQSPTWEIARIVYRVGTPRWPLAGVVEPLGPLGIAG